MGVLEDAIRDHLELKRRHGASDEEVERKELEALGPARREFEAQAEETADESADTPEAGATEAEAEVAEPDVAGAELPEDPVDSEPGEPEPEPKRKPRAHELPPEPLPEPEAATRIHESPIPDPALSDPRGPDFVEEEEPEQASEPKPQRDFDFD